MSDDSRYRDETEYRCTECKEPLTVTNKAPESYAPDWQVKPCQGCLDKLEEATETEKDEDWGKVEDGLKADLEARTEELNESQDKLRDVENERDTHAANLESLTTDYNALAAELQATKLLLKDAQQAHVFAKFRADRLSGEE